MRDRRDVSKNNVAGQLKQESIFALERRDFFFLHRAGVNDFFPSQL